MIRLVIADDHDVVRMGLRFVLKINSEIKVAAEAADGDEALKAVREHNPDILLLDIRMPGRDGLSALDEILAAFAGQCASRLVEVDGAGHVGHQPDSRRVRKADRALDARNCGESVLCADMD